MIIAIVSAVAIVAATGFLLLWGRYGQRGIVWVKEK
jgi:hypothetical protein